MKVLMMSALLYAAGAMQAGPGAVTYDAAFVLAQGTYTGTTTFEIGKDGKVTGTMKLTDPTIVDATLAGTVKDGTWTFEYTYTIPEQGCSGTVKGTATVDKDASLVKGEVTIGGACVEEPTQATFAFSKKKG